LIKASIFDSGPLTSIISVFWPISTTFPLNISTRETISGRFSGGATTETSIKSRATIG